MINKSLTTLGLVIDRLAAKGGLQPPYRDSVLTMLLKDSLGGNARTTIVATISPSSFSHQHSLGTLRYASRARDIVNVAVVNEDPKVHRIRCLEEDLERVRAMLKEQGAQEHEVGLGGPDREAFMELKARYSLAQQELETRDAALREAGLERQARLKAEEILTATENDKARLQHEAAELALSLARSREEKESQDREMRNLMEKLSTMESMGSALDSYQKRLEKELAEKEEVERRLHSLEDALATQKAKAQEDKAAADEAMRALAEKEAAVRAEAAKAQESLQAKEAALATLMEEFWCMVTQIAAPSSLPDGACYEWRCQMIPHPLQVCAGVELHLQNGGTHRALNMQDEDVAAMLMTALGEAVPTRSRLVYVAPQCLIDIPWGITSPPITLRAFSSPSAERITVGSRIPPLLVWLQDGYGRGVVHPGRFRTVTAILARPHGGHLIGTTTLQLDEKGTASFEDLSVTRMGENMILFTCPDQMNATDHSAALSAHVTPFLVTPMPEFLRLQGVPPTPAAEDPRPTAQKPKAALSVIKTLDINSAAKKSSRGKGVPPAGKHVAIQTAWHGMAVPAPLGTSHY